METAPQRLRVGLVGPCTSGKTLLRENLKPFGFRVYHIAQEHSFVPDMWQRLVNPDVLIFLDVSYPVTAQRRRMDWSREDYEEQQRRLSHARLHADLYIHTDNLSPNQVLQQALSFLFQRAEN